jgi:chemotaxis methyl-accepting protein methylase
MSLDPVAFAAARRALEAVYGLALEGLTEDQIAGAFEAALPTDLFFTPTDPRFLEGVLDRLPIDESWLFRDNELWTWLKGEVGPALLEQAMARHRPLRVLSIGCSTGQEPFSLAILFQGLLEEMGIPGSAASSYVDIQGIDSSPERIEAARAGAVSGWSVQRCRPDWLRGRVSLDDRNTGRFRIDPSVRAMCRFEVGNLLEIADRGNAALAGCDLVLCRHVLIYFRQEEAERIAGQLGRGLDPGALLALAAAEAHLIASTGALEPVPYLGAGRARSLEELRRAAASETHHRRRTGQRSAARKRKPAALPAGRPPERAPQADPAAVHIRSAIEHATAGRSRDAVREARAACFLDPRHLLSRMVLGQALIATDKERGHEVLRELLHHVSVLPQEAEVPSAPGLRIGQLTAAVRLLLGEREGI